jgi:hypothetical protein
MLGPVTDLSLDALAVPPAFIMGMGMGGLGGSPAIRQPFLDAKASPHC